MKFVNSTALEESERARINNVIRNLDDAHQNEVKYVIRTPGRINLIGDHIDYHGFSVIPMAISNSIMIYVATSNNQSIQDGDLSAPSKNHLLLLNTDRESYPVHRCQHSFSHGGTLDRSHQWYNYVLCGYHGVLSRRLLQLEADKVYDHAKRICDKEKSSSEGSQPDPNLDDKYLSGLSDVILVVDSNLPPASGLSSSSALVCGSALATHLVLDELENTIDLSIESESLAIDCAKFEHLVGTHGGGMDQAVILTAQEGYAKHVEFMPRFSCSNVLLPPGVVWLVSHCGESYPKAATSGFNSRVLETKLAAALILKQLKPSSTLALDHSITLYKVKDEILGPESLASELLSIIESKLGQELAELSLEEIALKLDLSRSELLDRFNANEEFLSKSGLGLRMCLLKRCKHVLEEADRVRKFKEICETTKDPKCLGHLMTQSHESLRDNYECSHPALDSLVDVALKSGALGARLTGAGWGGCIVTLVESSKAEQVKLELERKSKFTFRTEPQSGASIIKLV